MNKIQPNFFIVGASKAGTSSLAEALKQHPDIFMSDIKEPNFFNRFNSEDSVIEMEDLLEYSNFFKNARNESIIGEASVGYLPNKKAASWISHFVPDAKILISIRNPLERCRSMYEMYVRHGYKESFEHAIKGDGFLIKQNLYFDNIQRFINLFPYDHILIIEHDDLLKNWNATTKRILEFLKVDESYAIHKISKNFGGIPKNKKLSILTNRSLINYSKKIIPTFMRNPIDKFLKRHFYEKITISQEHISYLKSQFKEDLESLSGIVGHDLVKAWIQ